MPKVRPIVIDGDMARVPLTQGQVAVVDAADVELVSGRYWMAVQNRDTQSYYAKTGARRPDGRRTTQQMSRLILAAQPGQFVDHIDHDTLDNRRANLRLADPVQNGRNQRGAHRGSSSQYLGVSWHKARRRWVADTRVNGRMRHIGYFRIEEEAARARDEYICLNYPSEFWTLNFPDTATV
jgi:hypothetical protein